MTLYFIIQRCPAHVTEISKMQNFVLLFSSISIAIKVQYTSSILLTKFNKYTEHEGDRKRNWVGRK